MGPPKGGRVKAFLISGEPSGDQLGGALMDGLRQLEPGIAFGGIGGPLMQDQGLTSLFDMGELSVMGIAEVLPKYRHLKRRIAETAAAVIAQRPDVLITIDSPDFCLRVARIVRENAPDIRTVHYVAPSVWAWRPGRAQKMARVIDQVLALLPFEPPYMQAAGMRCDFVGHPVAVTPAVSKAEATAFRRKYGLHDGPLILVLPGSRKSEIERLLPVFGDALTAVSRTSPDAQFIIPAVAALAPRIGELVARWPVQPHILDAGDQDVATSDRRKQVAFGAADFALAASGTVSLELAAAKTPMVIAYDMTWFSWQIMSRMIRIDTVTLINLVTKQNVIPEFLGPECKADAIAAGLLTLMQDPTRQKAQLAAMADTMRALGQGQDPGGLRAARAVLDGLSTQGR